MKTKEEIEKEVREKFKDLPQGAYQISAAPWVVWTGREGFIQHVIEFRYAVQGCISQERVLAKNRLDTEKHNNGKGLVANLGDNQPPYTHLTLQMLKDAVEDFINGKNKRTNR